MSWTTPKVWAVGSPGTSSDMNQYVSDNTAFLYGDTAWTPASLQNSWVTYGGLTPGYRLAGSLVILRGAMKSGTTTGGTLLFTLPSGYRPSQECSPTCNANPNAASINIATSGAVTIGFGFSATATSIDGVVFSTV